MSFFFFLPFLKFSNHTYITVTNQKWTDTFDCWCISQSDQISAKTLKVKHPKNLCFQHLNSSVLCVLYHGKLYTFKFFWPLLEENKIIQSLGVHFVDQINHARHLTPSHLMSSSIHSPRQPQSSRATIPFTGSFTLICMTHARQTNQHQHETAIYLVYLADVSWLGISSSLISLALSSSCLAAYLI